MSRRITVYDEDIVIFRYPNIGARFSARVRDRNGCLYNGH